jgi:hypothetical protein
MYINFEKCKIILVCIIKDEKDRIIYNSGKLYFQNPGAADIFIREVSTDVEVVIVNPYMATPPVEVVHNGYYCPYCQRWEYWVSSEGKYKHCPVCGISDSEFYVKKYNGLWVKEMKSKSKKQKLDRQINKKQRKVKK